MALINGTAGAETLAGTAANDTVIGKAGNDTASMGAGNDLFVWNSGDGNDVVEGQAGFDSLRFNVSDDPETVNVTAAAGGRISLTRNSPAVALDVNDVERFDIRAAKGADLVIVNDLTGTDAKLVVVDLAEVPGGATGDLSSDIVLLQGNGANNNVNIGGTGKAISITGLSTQVAITRAETADTLFILSQDGDDKINAAGLTPGAIQLFAIAGNGNDTLAGSNGADNFSGDAGNDSISGNGGADSLFGGSENDTLARRQGRRSDFRRHRRRRYHLQLRRRHRSCRGR